MTITLQKKEALTAQLSLRVTPGTDKALRTIAKEVGTPLNQVCLQFLEAAIADYRKVATKKRQ